MSVCVCVYRYRAGVGSSVQYIIFAAQKQNLSRGCVLTVSSFRSYEYFTRLLYFILMTSETIRNS